MKDAVATMPKSWAPTTIGEICTTLQYGYTASASKEPCGPRFLRITDIQDGQVQWPLVPYCKIEGDVTQKYRLHPGDIVFARTGGTVGKSFIISSVPEQSVFASYLIRLSAHFEVAPKYLYYFFQTATYWEQIGLKKGGLQGNVNATTLSSLELFICPLNEQHRIVAKIEELFSELDKGIENLKTAQLQLKVYRQALLKHAFEGKLTAQWRAERNVTPAKAGVQPLNDMDSRLRGNDKPLETAEALLRRIQQERAQRYQQQLADWEKSPSIPLFQRGKPTSTAPIPPLEKGGRGGISKPKPPKSLPPLIAEELAELPELPEGWGWARPEEICIQEPYSIGIGPFGSNLKVSDYRESGIPLIFVKNITRSNFIKDLKYIDEAKYRELLPHSVKALDLLITKMGDPPGDCEIYPEGSPNAVLTADCLKFRLWDEFASRKLYKYCINSNFVKRQLGLITKGVAQKKISVERFKTICLPFFCVEEQNVLVQELESKLSEADQLDQTITTSLQQAEALRQSILKKAFSGQLVPQDPNDEPALELLARIRTEKAVQQNNKKGRL